MFYGHQTWDPVLICSQILAVQALWYLSLGSLLWLLLGAIDCLRSTSVKNAGWCHHKPLTVMHAGDAGPYVSHLTLHHLV